jgi:hypothetical protein
MVTGWNEWIAGRFTRPGNPVVFVDQFSEEFSRDIEPMKGGHADNYYYQLVANVRRFKGSPPIPKASAPKTIDLQSGFKQWKDVSPEFVDDAGDTAPRDHAGVAGLHYADHSGRNDLVGMKVARDEKNIYFYARTRDPIAAHTDPNWMWLLVDADGDAHTGWEGFDFIVNRTIENDHATWLEKNVGGWKWEKVAKIDYRVVGNEIQLAIPRDLMGIAEGGTKVSLNFKWADDIQHPGEIMDFYVSGDVAPEGRFMYRYMGE